MTTFTPDQWQQISAQYLAGEAPSELARSYRCDRADIETALDATATPRRKRGHGHGYASRAEMKDAIAERNARILVLHAEGKTVTEIMALVGLQRAAVCKILRAANGKRPAATDAEIVALRQAGATIKDIIETLHASHQRVTRVLAAAELLPAPVDLAQRAADIIRRRRGGEHPKAIAAAMGIGETTVYRALLDTPDLPPLRQPKPKPPKKAKAPKPPTIGVAPVLLDRPHRPPAQRRPAIRRAEGPSLATRTCHACEIQVMAADWSKHLAEVHGYNGKAAKARTTLDRYLEKLAAAPAEPTRPPEPACDICGAARCPTPLICARHRQARAQHHYQPRR